MNQSMMQLLVRWSVLALGVTIATRVVPGIACDNATTLVIVVVLLSFFNAVLKPLLVLLTLPFILLTMGLGIVLINAFLFMGVGSLVDGFHVASFKSALAGAVIVSLTNLLLNGLMGPKPPKGGGASGARGSKPRSKPDDVIDV